MSIQEEAERLRAIASSDGLPTNLLMLANDKLDSVRGQVLAVLGDQSQQAGNINGMLGAAADAIGTALGAVQQVGRAIHDAADYHARG